MDFVLTGCGDWKNICALSTIPTATFHLFTTLSHHSHSLISSDNSPTASPRTTSKAPTSSFEYFRDSGFTIFSHAAESFNFSETHGLSYGRKRPQDVIEAIRCCSEFMLTLDGDLEFVNSTINK